MNRLSLLSLSTILIRGLLHVAEVWNSTVGYIELLLLPFDQELQALHSMDEIKNWVNTRIPQEFIGGIHNSIETMEILVKRAKRPLTNEFILNNYKTAIIAHIFDKLMEQLSKSVTDVTVLTPWGIRVRIVSDETFTRLFPLVRTPNFTINTSINGDILSFEAPLEFIAGLRLFSELSGYEFKLKICGYKLPHFEMKLVFIPEVTKFIGLEQYNYYAYYEVTNPIKKNYRITTKKGIYWFETAKLLQGFTTGALWTGVDHHAYWSKIEQVTFNDKDEEIKVVEVTF